MDNDLRTYKINEIDNLKIYGRYHNNNPLALFWTGSGIEVNVKGSELWIEIESDYEIFEQWISVEIDNEQISRQMVPRGKNNICLFRGMNKDVIKNVHVYKEVQPMVTDDKSTFIIHNLKTDGTFEKIEDRNLKIEFIGDSITSGEGSIGAKKEEDWIPMWFTSLNNYTVMTAKLLNADFRIISQSGWGVLSSWDNNPNCALPKYYEKVCGVLNGDINKELGTSNDNDFEGWKPDFIVVNLGTNDDGAFHNPEYKDEKTGEIFKQHLNDNNQYNLDDINKFENAVVDFLYKLRKYNKDSHIIWAYGMIGIPIMRYIYRAVEKYKNETNDERVDILQLTSVTDKTIGARSHPGVLCHKTAANTLAEFIKDIER